MATQGLLTKFRVSYKETGSSTTTYTTLYDVQEIPDLGGNKDSIEITTMDDDAHVYMNGLENYGESLDFTILFNPTHQSQYEAFTQYSADNTVLMWKVEYDDGATSTTVGGSAMFNGAVSITVLGKGVNDAIQYRLSIKPTTKITLS